MESLTRNSFEIEVIYALDTHQYIRRISLEAGATAGDAVIASGLGKEISGVGQHSPLARFGRLIAWDTPLLEGDRVEILRPLRADPMESRRRRELVQAAAAKKR